MTEKLEYTAADMASAAAGGWRDGQRAAAEAAQSANEYTQGVCGDGAVILRDGVRMSVEDVLAALNAAQSAPAGEREAVEVVAWRTDSGSYTEDGDQAQRRNQLGIGPYLPLMTVAQHQRILAAQQRTQSAPVVPKGKVLVDVAVVEFLNGSGELHGMHFGDRIPGQPQFWWRHYLPTAPAQPAVQGEDDLLLELEGLRESLETARHNWRAFEDRCGDLQVENGKLRDRIAASPAQPEVQRLREALEHARLFIRNGIDLGYIRMPDADTPDPAHETLPMIDAALAASTGQEVGK